jgi:prolyl 4-hydroxylase
MFRWYYFLYFCARIQYCLVQVYGYNVFPKTQQLYTFNDHPPPQKVYGTKRKSYSLALMATSKSKKASRNVGAIGFGSSNASKRNKDTTNEGTSNNVISGIQQQPSSMVENDSPTIPLDKWGLPPPTLEDIFPLLSTDVERIPVDPTIQYFVNDTMNSLSNYYPNKINWKYVAMTGTSDHVNDDETVASSGHSKMKLRLAYRSPPVFMIDNFLSEEECKEVIRIVTETEHSSGNGENDTVIRVASKTISQQLALSKRTSTSWFCSYKLIPTVLAKVQHILGVDDLSRCEEPQIVRYDIGQEFTYHYDILPNEQTTNGGQRVATILIYLNTIAKNNGGSTTFRDLITSYNKNTTLSVQPVQGSALIFYPSNQFGQPDDRTLHRSLPIIQDQDDTISSRDNAAQTSKWILQIWIHETSYTACLPSNQNQIEDAYNGINAASHKLGYIS